MKKLLLLIMIAVIGLLAVSCSRKAEPVVLPARDTIDSIDVTIGDEAVNYSDDDWISRFVSSVLDAEGTRRQSIQDMPNEEEYIKIDINCRGSVNTLFVYKEKEIYYIEQPYQGIYQTDASFYEMLIGK